MVPDTSLFVATLPSLATRRGHPSAPLALVHQTCPTLASRHVPAELGVHRRAPGPLRDYLTSFPPDIGTSQEVTLGPNPGAEGGLTQGNESPCSTRVQPLARTDVRRGAAGASVMCQVL